MFRQKRSNKGKKRKMLHQPSWFVLLGCLAFVYSYFPAVPDIDLQEDTLLNNGWRECLAVTMDKNGFSLLTIETVCGGSYLYFGCREKGDDTLIIGGWANKTVIDSSGTQPSTSLNWYTDDVELGEIGFSTSTKPPSCLAETGSNALCWRLTNQTFDVGGYCGALGYTESANIERVVFARPCDGLANGAPCTSPQGNCAASATCNGATCVPSGVTTCPVAEPQCVDSVVCEPISDTCIYEYSPSSQGCSTGDLCSVEFCNGLGSCEAVNELQCPLPPPCKQPGVCLPNLGPTMCVFANSTDETPCSDANPCTQGDACFSGSCVPGTPKACNPPNQCINPGTCNTLTGNCVYTNKANGTPCTVNGNLCSLQAECQSATCVSTLNVSCGLPDDCFEPGVCITSLGICNSPPSPDGTLCNDQNACTDNTVCDSGVCGDGLLNTFCPPLTDCQLPGTAVDIAGQCVCVYDDRPDGTPCDNPDPCAIGSTCLAGSCTAASTKTCPPGPCRGPGAGVCIAFQGCSNAFPVGTPCDTDECFLNQECDAEEECSGGTVDFTNLDCDAAAELPNIF